MVKIVPRNKLLIVGIFVLGLVLLLIAIKIIKVQFNTKTLKPILIDPYKIGTDFKYIPSRNLFDISNFTYIIKPLDNYCNNYPLVIFIITSFYRNIETRSAIRRAYYIKKLAHFNFKKVFLLGTGPDNKYVNVKAIQNEASRFGDIVQGNFIEAYRNLTYKHVMGLKWISENCSSAKYVIKMDDDIVINLIGILTFLKSLNYKLNSIYGYMMRDLKVKRQHQNKWYVQKTEYHNDSYPMFLSGWFYITTPKVCQKLEMQSKNTKYFWIDDVYVTGIMAESLNINRFDISSIFTKTSEVLECCMKEIETKNIQCNILIGPNDAKTNLYYEFNKANNLCVEKKCLKRIYPISLPCTIDKNKLMAHGNSSIDKIPL